MPKESSIIKASMLESIWTSPWCHSQIIRECWAHSKALDKMWWCRELILRQAITRCRQANNHNISNNKSTKIRWIKQNITSSRINPCKKLKSLFNQMSKAQWRKVKKCSTNPAISLAFWIYRASCWMLKGIEWASKTWRGRPRHRRGQQATKR